MDEVTDPQLLAQLNSSNTPNAQEVTDPATLAQLNAPDEGALMAAGRGAVRNFPMAQQAVAGLEPGDYSSNLKSLVSGAEQAKAAHPVAYGAGAVAGTAAPLLIPGAGEAMEAAPILGNAALSAMQSQSDTDLTKPTAQNAKDALIAGGLGAGVGAIGKGLSAVAPSAKTMAANATGQGLGFTSRGAKNMMGGSDPEANIAELGNWANTVKTSEGKTLADYLRPGDKLKAINDIHDAAGKTIGDVLEKIAPEASIPKAGLTQDLYPLADELETLSPKDHGDVMNVISKINKLSDDGRLDLPALNKIKSFVGEASQDNPTMKRVYGSLSDSINKVIDEYGRVINDPSDRAVFDTAKVNYKNASNLLNILKRAEGKEVANGVMGNSGLLGMFGLASGVAAGHPVGGAASMVGSAIGRPIANMVGKNAALKAVPYMPAIAAGAKGLSKAAQLELANYLQSKLGGQK